LGKAAKKRKTGGTIEREGGNPVGCDPRANRKKLFSGKREI